MYDQTRLSLGLDSISLNVQRTRKLSIQDEKNVVLNENSVEGKPYINRESKSNELKIQLYSCHGINMNLLAVVTSPYIYQYPITVVAAHRLMISHSSAVVVKTKQCDSEMAFGQKSINCKAGYGTRRGSCNICKEEGKHSQECNNKENTYKSSKNKDDDEKTSISDKSSIPTTVDSNVKKETQVLESGTETGTNYDSNHDVFELTFYALGG